MKENTNKHYENLFKLYLRLNGYFVTNLIIHSKEKGNLKSEIDVVAIRFPFHKQEDRQVETSCFLECENDAIEVLIADCKNVNNCNNVKFNDSLRKYDDSIKKLISWIGFNEDISNDFVTQFREHLNSHNINHIAFAQFKEQLPLAKFNFKFTFFCPSLPEWNNSRKGYKYIHFDEVIDFIWKCLNKTEEIESCSKTYNYKNWNEFKPYILIFKQQNKKPTKERLEKEMNQI